MSTLAQLRDLVEAELRDSTNDIWSTGQVDAAIRQALRAYERVDPQRLVYELHTSADTWEYATSGMAGLLEVIDVWFPWCASDPEYPPGRPQWSRPYDGYIRLEVDSGPIGDDTDNARVFYTAAHVIEDLDSGSATTLSAQGEGLVVLGASAYCALSYAQDLIGEVTVSGWTPKQLLDWGSARMDRFHEELRALAARLIAVQDSRVVWDGDV